MAFAVQVGTGLAALTGAMLLLGLAVTATRRQSWRSLAPLALVSVTHPGLWSGPRPDDCGQSFQITGLMFTILAVVLLGWVLARPRIAAQIEEDVPSEG